MKLVDILARELKVWPELAKTIEQSAVGMVFFDPYVGKILEVACFDLADDWRDAQVTQAQWQAAVDALKAEKSVEWNGEGLPPVGTVCEFAGFNPEETMPTDPRVGDQVTVIAHFMSGSFEVAAFTFYAPPEFEYLQVAQGAYGCFRPIRTPEQIAADERSKAIEAMEQLGIGNPSRHDLLAALYDAGYRKFEIVDN